MKDIFFLSLSLNRYKSATSSQRSGAQPSPKSKLNKSSWRSIGGFIRAPTTAACSVSKQQLSWAAWEFAQKMLSAHHTVEVNEQTDPFGIPLDIPLSEPSNGRSSIKCKGYPCTCVCDLFKYSIIVLLYTSIPIIKMSYYVMVFLCDKESSPLDLMHTSLSILAHNRVHKIRIALGTVL